MLFGLTDTDDPLTTFFSVRPGIVPPKRANGPWGPFGTHGGGSRSLIRLSDCWWDASTMTDGNHMPGAVLSRADLCRVTTVLTAGPVGEAVPVGIPCGWRKQPP
jgi:hypothetical protein